MTKTKPIKDQSSAIAAVKSRSRSDDPAAVLDAAEAWAKANDNTFVELTVRHARKQDKTSD